MSLAHVMTLAVLTVAMPSSPCAAQSRVRTRTTSEAMPVVTPDTPPAATGGISGQVVSASGSPVRRAHVTLEGPDVRRTTATDANGRYAFSELPAGAFDLQVTKTGFLATSNGETANRSGTPITLTAGQTVSAGRLILRRGGAIAGRVLDEFGDPVTGASVDVLRLLRAGGRVRMVAVASSVETDDLGQFRVHGLPPGNYVVRATIEEPEVSTSLASLAPSFHPGTAAPGEAAVIRLSAGEDRRDLDVQLVPTRLSEVSGRVVSNGHPGAQVRVSLSLEGIVEGSFVRSTQTGADGTFAFDDVPPGRYLLQVEGGILVSHGGVSCTDARNPSSSRPNDTALQSIAVGAEDLTNLVIPLTAGTTVSGRVRFEGPRPAGAFRVLAQPGEIGGLAMLAFGCGVVTDDATFRMDGVPVGASMLAVDDLPDGYAVKAVVQDGRDVTDSGLDFVGPGEASGVEIVVTSRPTELVAQVTGADGKPVTDFTLVVFAQDPARWTLPSGRWARGAFSDDSGRARIVEMPAGAYYAVAVSELPARGWENPDTLDRLKGGAERIVLADGERKALSLSITRQR